MQYIQTHGFWVVQNYSWRYYQVCIGLERFTCINPKKKKMIILFNIYLHTIGNFYANICINIVVFWFLNYFWRNTFKMQIQYKYLHILYLWSTMCAYFSVRSTSMVGIGARSFFQGIAGLRKVFVRLRTINVFVFRYKILTFFYLAFLIFIYTFITLYTYRLSITLSYD